MRICCCSAIATFLLASPLFLLSQQLQKDYPKPFYFVSVTDPACPVSGYPAPVPVTNELRVFYFPMGEGATIKEPKAPILHLVFNDGFSSENLQNVLFTRREDGVWVAAISMAGNLPSMPFIGWRTAKPRSQTPATASILTCHFVTSKDSAENGV